MANTSFLSSSFHSTDALFRTWGSGMNAALVAVGMVQTADTGQVNWTTVVRAANNSDAGYEVWRFNDALQATVPIFFKLYYGTDSNAGRPRLRIELGTGSNGSGVITGTGAGTITTLAAGTNSLPALYDSWMSSDGSGLAFAGWLNNGNGAHPLLVIDRFRDIDGAAVSKGWYWGMAEKTRGVKSVTIIDSVSSSLSTLTNTFPCLVPMTLRAGYSAVTADNQLMFFPHYVACHQGLFYCKMIVSILLADLGFNSLQTVSHLGTTVTLRSMGSHAVGLSTPSNGNVGGAIWWA